MSAWRVPYLKCGVSSRLLSNCQSVENELVKVASVPFRLTCIPNIPISISSTGLSASEYAYIPPMTDTPSPCRGYLFESLERWVSWLGGVDHDASGELPDGVGAQ